MGLTALLKASSGRVETSQVEMLIDLMTKVKEDLMAGPVTGLAYYNQQMVGMAEHWDEFLLSRTLKNPNIWHDRIPRGSYKLYSGTEQKSNIFRGGLGVQSGLNTW